MRCFGLKWALLLAALLGVAIVFWPALTLAAPACPSAGSFPTPGPGVPNAPSDADFVGGVLTWSDNANNEDGYLICARPGDFEHTVGSGVTSFVPPPDWPPGCPDVEYADYNVYAFNESGLSSPGGWSIIVECPVASPVATSPATSTAPAAALPPSGEGIGHGASGSAPTELLVGILLAFAFAAGLVGMWSFRA